MTAGGHSLEEGVFAKAQAEQRPHPRPGDSGSLWKAWHDESGEEPVKREGGKIQAEEWMDNGRRTF